MPNSIPRKTLYEYRHGHDVVPGRELSHIYT